MKDYIQCVRANLYLEMCYENIERCRVHTCKMEKRVDMLEVRNM